MKNSLEDGSMNVNMNASMSEVQRKKVKPKLLKESSFNAGLAAFRELESAEGANRPIILTARDLVKEGIESIMRARMRGVPLIRIYNDARKAAKLKITFQTFSSYVSWAAKEAGLSMNKTKMVTQRQPDWHCSECETKAERRESTKQPGTYFWKCPVCHTFYKDENGTITHQRLN